ncbi:MAG: hypothetical protein AAF840_05320, partial [Bacteroidota bacterium]
MINTTIRINTLFAFLLLFVGGLNAQTNISSTINQYSAVTGVDLPGNSVTVASATPFTVGDQVLLIQMQGATIDETNTGSFGTITDQGGAGSYELAIVCAVDGNTITLENELINTDYAPGGGLQLVAVPTYENATVTATLTGQAWDGTTGGVVALQVLNTLTLDAPISMDGKGFRGGTFENAVSNCNFIIPVNNYFYDTPNDGGGRKGESIAAEIAA